MICYFCKKHTVIGRSKRHKRGVAGKRWRKRAQVTSRTFGANIQKRTLKISGKSKQVSVCTKCLKRIKKDGKVKGHTNIALG